MLYNQIDQSYLMMMYNGTNLGADQDIEKLPFVKVYCVYWDYDHNVINQPVMWAETLYPISLLEAIEVFRPEFAQGVNCVFEYVDGSVTDTIVFRFT